MKKILILNPLKDLPHWGLTTHARNIFPKFPGDEFVSYAYFDNPSFAEGSLHQLPIYNLKTVWPAIRQMRRVQPDILYGTGSIVEILFFLMRPRGAKYVFAWHGPYDKQWILSIGGNSFRSRVSFHVATYLSSRADLLMCDSEYIASSLRTNFPNKKVVITLNGVDGKFFDPARRDKKWLQEKLSIPAERPVFIFMGHMIKRKRPELFVALARRFPEALFIMAGREGYYKKSDIERWQAEQKNLRWFFSFSREDTARLFSSSEGLVFPSIDEPFGLSVIEAMASGAPVVATRSGALPELIEDKKEGVLILEEADELDRYEKTIRWFATRDADVMRLIASARAKTQTIFNWAGVAARYEKAFGEL